MLMLSCVTQWQGNLFVWLGHEATCGRKQTQMRLRRTFPGRADSLARATMLQLMASSSQSLEAAKRCDAMRDGWMNRS